MIEGVLFDLDGLLVDSEPLWSISGSEIMAWLGGPWDLTVKAACLGKRLDQSCRAMVAIAGADVAPEAVMERQLARMCELYRAELPMLPGAFELLDELTERAVPLAVVSSSYRVLVDAALETVGAGRFAFTIAGDEVTHAKPHPEPYARAAAALGADPARCVVLEDSETGALSAEAAGCTVVVVPNVVGVAAAGGRVIVSSLKEVGADLLASLVTKA